MSDYVSTNDKFVVPFSDNEEVTDDQLIVEADKPGDSPEVKAQRAEKRRERAATRERERKEQTDRLARLESELASEKAARARLEGYVTAVAKPAEPAGQDPLDAVYEEQKSAWASYQAELKAGTLDEKRAEHYEGISRRLEEAKTRIHTERAIASREGNRRQETAQQVWVNKYPDVYNNPQAFQYAQATFQRRLALGEKQTNELVDEVMGETLSTFKLGPKPKTARNERERMSGSSAGGGGGGGGDADTSRGIAPTKELMKMAQALHSDKSPEEAFKLWVNGPGRELRKQKVL